jgi:hypothetical protein
MATRTIVTSQPDVACDVCARRLLRGEQPDVFVGAGRRRIVCELCAPRAAHEGWLRETESQSPGLAPARPRRGGGLFERLPVPFRARRDADGSSAAATLPAASATEPPPASDVGEVVHAQVQAPGEPLAHAPVEPPAPAEMPAERSAMASLPAPGEPWSETGATHEQSVAYLPEAIAVFNASEFPRRVAGVIRSLGAPLVTVRSAEHLVSVVRIVVAWELCWYCYEVDLSEPAAEAQVIAQGSELAELAREDRAGNAAAADSGTLLLAAAA